MFDMLRYVRESRPLRVSLELVLTDVGAHFVSTTSEKYRYSNQKIAEFHRNITISFFVAIGPS